MIQAPLPNLDSLVNDTEKAVPEADIEVLSKAVISALTGGKPCAIPLSFLRRCTNGFNDARIVGEGGFGRVYRAVDPASGTRFAVERMGGNAGDSLSMQRELDVLTSIQHTNMIKLLGYCATQDAMCLVYEFGALGSWRTT
jgi:serine/threonine protein kinase